MTSRKSGEAEHCVFRSNLEAPSMLSVFLNMGGERHCYSSDKKNTAAKVGVDENLFPGNIAQLGEHMLCKHGVESSNLFVSTGRLAPLVRALGP